MADWRGQFERPAPGSVQLKQALPHPRLRAIVSGYGERRGHFSTLKVIRPLNARADQFMEFYFRDPYRVRQSGTRFDPTYASVLVGVTSEPGKDLGILGELETFTIRFKPTGLSRLFGVPMHETVDQGIALSDILKRETAALEDALRQSTTFEERVVQAEIWLGAALDQARPLDAIDHVAGLMARSAGRFGVSEMSDHVGLSARQLQRRFLQDVGVTPKFYARLHRFEAAIKQQTKYPDMTWAALAAACGFADEAHLSREARALTGLTPNAFAAEMHGVATGIQPAPVMSDLFKFGAEDKAKDRRII
jgi:AraC-like DNA-binding protein